MTARHCECHNATEPHILTWLILCCVIFISIKKKNKSKKKKKVGKIKHMTMM